MARAKQKPQLMAEQNVHLAHQLLQERSQYLKRLAIARGCDPTVGSLGITLQGRYQDEEFVDLIRPRVCQVILEQIHEIDCQLRELGVEPSPVPQPPTPEKPVGLYDDDGGGDLTLNLILHLMLRLLRWPTKPQNHYAPYVPIEKYMDDLKAATSNGSESDMRVIRQPGCSLPKTATLPTQPEHADIEKLIHDTVARWHGDQFDRRPLAKVLTETLRPYLKNNPQGEGL